MGNVGLERNTGAQTSEIEGWGDLARVAGGDRARVGLSRFPKRIPCSPESIEG